MKNLPVIDDIFDDKYEIQEVVGSGGIGTVYKALQLDCSRTVALKILQPHAAIDEEYRARFIREARALSKLQHRNIVAVYNLGIAADSMPYLAMEYLRGRSIRRILDSSGRIPVRRSLKIVADAARALAYVHKQGIIHRDLKPENLLLVDLPEPDTVKLLDFGLISLSGPDQRLTVTGELIGTSAYMSPEQCKGLPVDLRTDIYSLSVCLHEMVTGTRPFDSDTPVGLMYKHINDPTPAIKNAQVDQFHPALNKLISRGMAKNPEARFACMDELADEIDSLLADLNSPAGKFSARMSVMGVWMTIPVVVLVCLSFFCWFKQPQTIRQNAGRAIYEKQPNKSSLERFYKTTLKNKEKLLGADNPEVVDYLKKLADFYTNHERYSEAEPVLKRILALRKKELEPDSATIAHDLSLLAKCKSAQNKNAEAEPLFAQALEIQKKAAAQGHLFGESCSFEDLAVCKEKLGKYSEAEPLFQQSLELREAWENSEQTRDHAVLLGRRNSYLDPDGLAKIIFELADNYAHQKKFARAEQLFRRALEIKPEVTAYLLALAELYTEQNKYAESEQLFKHAVKVCEKDPGPHQSYLRIALVAYGAMLRKTGRPAEAVQQETRAASLPQSREKPERP